MKTDIEKLFKGFVKICDSINKIYNGEIIASNGVFMWFNNRALSVLTFKEKLEQDAIPFLTVRFSFTPSTVLFIDKYFNIEDIKFSDGGIKFTFTGDISSALSDKLIESILPLLSKESEGRFSISFPYVDHSNSTYNRICTILYNIGEGHDHTSHGWIEIENLDKEEIMKSDKPIVIDQDGIYIRLARSAFQSINSKDTISVKFLKYVFTDSTFLCMATVSKEQCHLINIFSVLRI